jgi:hypothetical protein
MSNRLTSKKISPADVTWLARTWEDRVRAMDYQTKKLAAGTLLDLCHAYLRGMGIRMGNPKSFHRHKGVASGLFITVIKRVIEDEGKENWFPTLVRMGFSSMESVENIARELRETI